MSEDSRPNIYADEWERTLDQGSYGLRAARVAAAAGAQQLGAAVYEIDPGRRNLPYHTHYGIEELLVVLRGTPTLRAPDGERELSEGEVVVFPPGPDGAHQVLNHGDKVVRFMIVSTRNSADLVEYPDSGKISAQGGNWGTPGTVAYMLSTANQLGYFDGEPE